MTVDIEGRIDLIDKFDLNDLMEYARGLWPILFGGNVLKDGMSGPLAAYYRKYMKIASRLDHIAADATKTKNVREKAEVFATYMRDRVACHNANFVATNSGWALNYETLLKGGEEWIGAQVEVVFNAGHVLRLLYGHKIDFDYAKITDPEQQRRSVLVREALAKAWQLYTEVTSVHNPAYANSTGRTEYQVGPFHAVQDHNASFKQRFQAAVRAHVEEHHAAHKTTTTGVEDHELDEAMDIFNTLLPVIDLRTTAAMALYLGAHTMSDDMAKTIGTTSQIVTDSKASYVAGGKPSGAPIGKMQYVRPSISGFLDRLQGVEADSKLSNIAFAMATTDMWTAQYCEHWDHLVNEEERLVTELTYDDPFVLSPITFGFWLPVAPTDPGMPVPLSSFEHRRALRDAFMLSQDNTVYTSGRYLNPTFVQTLSLSQYLTVALEYPKISDKHDEGIALSGKPDEDIAKVREQLSKILQESSISRVMIDMRSAMRGRVLVAMFYNFYRLLIIGFDRKVSSNDKRGELTRDFIFQIRAFISQATSLQMPIYASSLTQEFCDLLGFKYLPNDNKPVARLHEILLRMLPYIEETGNIVEGERLRYNINPDLQSNIPDEKTLIRVYEIIQSSSGYHASRDAANHRQLHHHQTRVHSAISVITDRIEALFSSPTTAFKAHPHLYVDGDRTAAENVQRQYFKTIKHLPEFSAQSKRSDESE